MSPVSPSIYLRVNDAMKQSLININHLCVIEIKTIKINIK